MMRLVTFPAQADQVVQVVCLIRELIRRQDMMHCRSRYNLSFGRTPLALVMITRESLRSQVQPPRAFIIHVHHSLVKENPASSR